MHTFEYLLLLPGSTTKCISGSKTHAKLTYKRPILDKFVSLYLNFKLVWVLLLYIFGTHPTRRHPTRRNDDLTQRAWNQRGAAQVIKYEI